MREILDVVVGVWIILSLVVTVASLACAMRPPSRYTPGRHRVVNFGLVAGPISLFASFITSYVRLYFS